VVRPGRGAVTELQLSAVVEAWIALQLVEKVQARSFDAVELAVDDGIAAGEDCHRVATQVVELGTT